MTDLRLILFDVDGTLVDSQGSIVSAMQATFAAEGMTAPNRATLLSIVGLSLEHAMTRLAPHADAAQITRMAETYKAHYHRNRVANGVQAEAPLYPGARTALDRLHAVPENLLGVATGKSRRGMRALIDGHDLHHFVTTQVADDHPSKPHPSMILTALAETGVAPENAVMIGDTTYDMDMARAAGVAAIGVSWGYHPAAQLRADVVIGDFSQLETALNTLWKVET